MLYTSSTTHSYRVATGYALSIVAVMTGTLLLSSCSTSARVPGLPQPSQLLARLKAAGQLSVTMQDVVPGVAEQQPWPNYTGFFDTRKSTGQLNLKKFPLFWITGRSSTTLVGIGQGANMPVAPRSSSASVYVPFSAATDATTASVPGNKAQGGSNGQTVHSSGSPSGVTIPFADVGRSGASDPMITYESLIVNPGIWIDMLNGVSSISKGVPGSLGRSKSYRYDVTYNLIKAAQHIRGPAANALDWLSSYLDLTNGSLLGQLWLSASLVPVRMLLVRTLPSAPLPRTAAGLSPSGNSEYTVMTFRTGRKTPRQLPTPRYVLVLGTSGSVPHPCIMAGGTGLTARVIALPGQAITGTIDATGCDIGVYIGPKANGAGIDHATITGAKVHAVLVAGTNGTLISNSTLDTAPDLSLVSMVRAMLVPQDKAVVLVGTSHATITANNISGALSGGLAIVDDGPVDPGGINPGVSRPSIDNVVERNTFTTKAHQCGIVVAAYNPGEGVTGNTVKENKAVGVAIVVATDAANTSATSNVISDNNIAGAQIPGILIHSNARNDVLSGTMVVGNVLKGNGPDSICHIQNPSGIALIANYAPIISTSITGNTITDEKVAIWTSGSHGETIAHNKISLLPGGTSVYHSPSTVSCSEIF